MINECKTNFQKHGYAKIEGFYDFETEVEPLLSGIYNIIGQVMLRHGIKDLRDAYRPENFDSQFMALIAIDRGIGGEIYDAAKQLPAFRRLTSLKKNEELFEQMHTGSIPGFAVAGDGLRINIPEEEKYRAEWHQEYPAQLRSPVGMVFWTPLIEITQQLGPVKICAESHRSGIIAVITFDPENPTKSGAYALRLKNEEEIIGKYSVVEPLSSPGDLLIMDFSTIHCSGFNAAQRPLWSVQFRYFDFDTDVGRKIGWAGSFRDGNWFGDIHPELVAD